MRVGARSRKLAQAKIFTQYHQLKVGFISRGEYIAIFPALYTVGDLPIPWQTPSWLGWLGLNRADAVGEVAPVAVGAAGFFPKCIAWLGFVGVLIDIAPEFLDPVGELALEPVRTVPFFRVVSAQRALHLVLDDILLLGFGRVGLQGLTVIAIG